MLRESLRFLVGEEVEKRIEIGLAKDGSGVGGEYLIMLILTTVGLTNCSCVMRSASHKAILDGKERHCNFNVLAMIYSSFT